MSSNPFSRSAPGPDPYAIEHEEFEQAVKAGECVVVDVREAHEFASAHIPSSLNMPLSTLNPQGLPSDKPVVLICHSGMRSRSAQQGASDRTRRRQALRRRHRRLALAQGRARALNDGDRVRRQPGACCGRGSVAQRAGRAIGCV